MEPQIDTTQVHGFTSLVDTFEALSYEQLQFEEYALLPLHIDRYQIRLALAGAVVLQSLLIATQKEVLKPPEMEALLREQVVDLFHNQGIILTHWPELLLG